MDIKVAPFTVSDTTIITLHSNNTKDWWDLHMDMLFSYERDFMSLSDDKQADIIDTFTKHADIWMMF